MQTNTPLKIALVGAGGISNAHLPAYQNFRDKVELVAVCDVNEAAAKAFAGKVGESVRVYTDYQALLEDTEVEAIDLLTLHCDHAKQAIAALKAGKHVLIEKPLAINLPDCEAVIAQARASDRIAMVAQCQRYHPSYLAAKEAIESGRLGEIRAVRFDCMQNLPMYVKPGHWLYDGDLAGGGVVMSVMIHRIDLMRYLIGEIRSVRADCRHTSKDFIHGAEDFANVWLEFENGAVGDGFGAYSLYRTPYSENLMIFGTDGTLHAVPPVGEWIGDAYLASRETEGEGENPFQGFQPLQPAVDAFPTDDGFVNEILHFADCCRTGERPVSDATDTIESMKVIFAIYQSSRTGEAVRIADL